MTNVGEGSGQIAERRLDDIIRDAGKYYNYLKAKEVNQTRLDVVVVGAIVWFSAFVALGLSSLAFAGCLSPSAFSACVSTTPSKLLFQFLLVSAEVSTVIAAASGVITYAVRRRRRFKFAELGALLNKMKDGTVSSEDGLHLMDAMHQAALVVKKRRVDSAFEYGVVAFILFTIVGGTPLVSIPAAALGYLYFRKKALREYEKEDKRYEDSKKELFQSL